MAKIDIFSGFLGAGKTTLIKKLISDGHSFESLRAAFAEAETVKGRPSVIIARTVKGKGVSFMENEAGWHGKAPNAEQYEAAHAELAAAVEKLEVE